MLSGIYSSLSNIENLILGAGIFLLVFDIFREISRELDFLQEVNEKMR